MCLVLLSLENTAAHNTQHTTHNINHSAGTAHGAVAGDALDVAAVRRLANALQFGVREPGVSSALLHLQHWSPRGRDGGGLQGHAK